MSNANVELAEMARKIAALQAENEKLKKASTGKLTLKVGEKGGVCVYGLGRFPVSLYKEQWARLLGHADQIKAFIEANDSRLASKGDPRPAVSEPAATVVGRI